MDSAATTLLASASSSKGTSLDEERKGSGKRLYADYELERFDQKQRGGVRYVDDDTDEGRGQDDEQDHLLGRQLAGVGGGEAVLPTPQAPKDAKPQPVSWSSLPKKTQLAILTCARLSEPLTQTSLAAYMFYQLKSFPQADGSPPSDATVAKQVGLLAAAFTGAQFCTAILWGRMADNEHVGRKRVILIGLLGTTMGTLGFGFSRSFRVAVFWRCVGGMLNGNVGVMRTMISEMISEKKFQSRAFLLMPMTFNIGNIIGPLLGGLLADPVTSFPGVFGPGSTLGGAQGVWWLTHWPYALPNVVSAVFLASGSLAVTLGLEETLESRRGKSDWGSKVGKWLWRALFNRNSRTEYHPIGRAGESDVEMLPGRSQRKDEVKKVKNKLPFQRIWTSNFLLTLLAHGLLAGHVGTFNALWFVFLSTPRYDADARDQNTTATDSDPSTVVPKDYHPHLPFTFTGGLALPPPSIGTALAILGVIGISLQLLLYPRLSFRLGTVRSYRLALLLFPISYFFAPYLSVVTSSTLPPLPVAGPWIWLAITLLLLVQVTARTFALPSTTILVNNACPHPSVLGTVHGIAQSASSAMRTVGPIAVGWAYAKGLEIGVIGLAWWGMAAVAVVGAIAGRWVREGDGHEIWLEGEREAEEEAAAVAAAKR